MGLIFMSKPTLGYWKIRGLAQSDRLQLAHAGVDFEDRHFEKGEEWAEMKAKLTGCFANLPYMKDGDFEVAENVAVTRYIAQKWAPATLGSTPEIAATADMIYSILHPLRFTIVTMACYVHGVREQIKAESRGKIGELAVWMADKQWLEGEELTWVDFYGYESIVLFNELVWEGKFFDEFPVFKEYHARVAGLEKVAEFLKNQEKLPFNAPMAKIGGAL